MRNLANLKSLIIGVAILLVAYFAFANFLRFESLRNNPTIENTVEATAVNTPTPQASSDFRPDGGFELSSKPPKSFKEISWLSLITGSPVGYGSGCAPPPCVAPPTPSVENRVNWVVQTPRGILVTDDGTYPWKNESISVENFSFVTETRKNQSYQFTGHFTSGGNYEELKPKDTVLVGRLTKMIDGKIVAEDEVNFTWFSWEEVDNETYSHKKTKPKE